MTDYEAALLFLACLALLLLRGVMKKRKRGKKRVFVSTARHDD